MQVLNKVLAELEQIRTDLARIRDNPNLLKVEDIASSTPKENKRNRYLRALEDFWENLKVYNWSLEHPISNEEDQLIIRSSISKMIKHRMVTNSLPVLRDGAEIKKILMTMSYEEVEKKYQPIRPYELRNRLTILEKNIKLAQFDDILNDPPEKTILGIMGYTGALLERNGINPMEGSTYRELSLIEKNGIEAQEREKQERAWRSMKQTPPE